MNFTNRIHRGARSVKCGGRNSGRGAFVRLARGRPPRHPRQARETRSLQGKAKAGLLQGMHMYRVGQPGACQRAGSASSGDGTGGNSVSVSAGDDAQVAQGVFFSPGLVQFTKSAPSAPPAE